LVGATVTRSPADSSGSSPLLHNPHGMLAPPNDGAERIPPSQGKGFLPCGQWIWGRMGAEPSIPLSVGQRVGLVMKIGFAPVQLD